jgi:chemotaxis protein methyltransferase CheR
VSDAVIEVAALLEREFGIVTQDSQLDSLAAAISRLAPELEAPEFLAEVTGGGRLLSMLVDEVTIQETYFLRDEVQLSGIDWPDLVASGGAAEPIRVWVPACATGEEAFTLSILAMEALETTNPPVSIIATDISQGAIAAAMEGSYSPRSMANVPPEWRERYFIADGRNHRVGPHLRNLVHFRRHNLITEAIPPPGETPFDLIVCRNVLIYFRPETAEATTLALLSALRPHGKLVLGAADRLTGTSARMARVTLPASPSVKPVAPPVRELRRPLGREVAEIPAIETAIGAADAGDLGRALEVTAAILDQDPLNVDALFVQGLAQLGLDDAGAAIASLRQALFADPSFGLAAFQLGRAHDAAGDSRSAIRAYRVALNTLDPDDDRHSAVVNPVELSDVAAACRVRLAPKAEAPS